jgi:hypothetical protein
MEREWILEVEAESDKRDSYVIRLGIKDAQSNQTLRLIAACSSIEQLQREIDGIKAELDRLPAEARQRLHSSATGTREQKPPPETVWKKMEAFSSETEMFAYYNALDEAQRSDVAEYIFTHVNMFKGRGPIFSEHYDSVSHLLE